MNGKDAKAASVDCYVALELSRNKWLVGALLPGSDKVATISVAGGDTDGLLAALNKCGSRATDAGHANVTLRVCFEAGYDGFWLARFLIDRGIDTTVLDASSFLVSRKGRRVKTDHIDVEAMAFVLKAFLLGDKSVCRPVRIPSPEEEDAKRITRERAQLLKERTRNVNRIRALLNLQGIRNVRGLWGGKWEQWLSQIRTADGRPLGRFLLKELARQFERLKLLSSQLKSLEIERGDCCSGADDTEWQEDRHAHPTLRRWRGRCDDAGHGSLSSTVQEPKTSCVVSRLGAESLCQRRGRARSGHQQGRQQAGARDDGRTGLVLVSLSATKSSRAMVSPPFF